ncbi:DUF3888 domain-containing protein [Cytobacillus oceanisediminis]|uniref:DUF3888 domain-containing protein n=1 Tax=Cytobacillus oceanisediminis TaxID=665099 RepID=UPI001C21A502|nr:DUF3888 domain-containing protein [Cytobacillus oceanisediminis]MBU8733551.1 DUF3888 domain-containing protein [Cytobacillus oceanisediminis]
MKKLLYYLIIAIVLTFISSPVYAEKPHRHDSKGSEQVFDNFMMELCHEEILNAVRKFYQDDSLRVRINWWDKKYDVVKISQDTPDKSYLVKFTVLPFTANALDKKSKYLGTDTITFNVEPHLFIKENNHNNLPAVKFLKYQHNKAPKN